ncbi:phage scaffolding protein [Macrococcus brunensis]|uniref:phage scaffolding protein n=1 Tax=Macrococcus brunensis TaxID=198483 RepID=UPI001EF10FFB|nr:phage scaffolding protein [Macrococcus brunensis]ULG73023.1 phage scaffolding protein [Macrococcus brunensis]
MERKDLIELGIENETVDKIMEMHGKTVNPLKQTNESLKAEVDSYKEQVTDRDNQLEEIKSKVGDTDALNVTIESLKQANKDKDDAHQAKMKQVQLDYEVTLALNKANARNEKAVKALLDLDTVKINEDGQLIGLSEQLSNLQETDSYLFDTETVKTNQTDGSEKKDTSFNPGNNRSNDGKETTPEEIGKAAVDRLFGKKE